MGTYLCPVCGFPNLDVPAWDLDTGIPSFNICPSSGCEFGYNDATPQAKENLGLDPSLNRVTGI